MCMVPCSGVSCVGWFVLSALKQDYNHLYRMSYIWFVNVTCLCNFFEDLFH